VPENLKGVLLAALRWIIEYPWKALGALLAAFVGYALAGTYDAGGPTFSARGRCQTSEQRFAEHRVIGMSTRTSAKCRSEHGVFITTDAPNGEVELVLSEGRLTGWIYLREVRDGSF